MDDLKNATTQKLLTNPTVCGNQDYYRLPNNVLIYFFRLVQIFAVSLMTRQQACVNVGCSLGRSIHSAETTTALETRYACFEALETRYVCFAAENTLNERMIK